MYNCRGLNSATSLPDQHVFGREVRPEPDAVKPWMGMSESGGGGVAEEELRRRVSSAAGWLSVLPWSVPQGSLGSLQI